MSRRPATDPIFTDGEVHGEDAVAPHGLWSMLGWFVSLLILTALFGFVIALAVFFLAFLRVHAREGWNRTAILTVGGIGGLILLGYLLNRDFPPGVLQTVVDLPWPLSGR